jgi:hypothetical protein
MARRKGHDIVPWAILVCIVIVIAASLAIVATQGV